MTKKMKGIKYTYPTTRRKFIDQPLCIQVLFTSKALKEKGLALPEIFEKNVDFLNLVISGKIILRKKE